MNEFVAADIRKGTDVTQSTTSGSRSEPTFVETAPRPKTTRETRLKRLAVLTRLLDDAFVIPGTNVRMGWDGIIGLVPGAGDLLTGAASLYIVYEAAQLGASKPVLVRMLANVGIDVLAGSVPVVGDVFDVAWKANKKNLRLLHRHLGITPSEQRRA